MPQRPSGNRNQSRQRGASSRPAARRAGGNSRSQGAPKGAPVSGKVSSSYGTRKDPKTGKEKFHKGVDIKAKVGTNVQATGGGKVIKAGWENPKNHKQGYGQRIVIDHGNGNTSIVGHLKDISVKKGDAVKQGQVIGHSGNTGRSTGPHVHYEERYKGKPHRPTYHPKDYKPKK